MEKRFVNNVFLYSTYLFSLDKKANIKDCKRIPNWFNKEKRSKKVQDLVDLIAESKTKDKSNSTLAIYVDYQTKNKFGAQIIMGEEPILWNTRLRGVEPFLKTFHTDLKTCIKSCKKIPTCLYFSHLKVDRKKTGLCTLWSHFQYVKQAQPGWTSGARDVDIKSLDESCKKEAVYCPG